MAHENGEDLGLMERLSEGDDSALSELIRKWKLPVLRFAYRYLGHTTDAEEVAAETFVKIHRHRSRFKPSRGKFSTWLFAIAANEAKMRLRWRRRHPEKLCSEHPEWERALGEERSDPAAESALTELGQALAKAIVGLPHGVRVVFVLYEIEGQSYRDIAETIGCSEKAVERRLSRARELLRLSLGAQWSEYQPA